MFNRAAFENSRAGGVAVLEVREPSADGEQASTRFVPLKRTDIAGYVIGPVAAMRVTHTYGYTREQCPLTLEALYRFPLPGDAAVTELTVRFGDVEIRADLRAREQAEAEYAEAKKEGKQAALLTRELPDVFTVAIAGLQPDQDVTVVTGYSQLARLEGAGWSLRIPLTTAPRYVRSDETGARQARGQPLALLRDPGHRFTLDVTLRSAARVSSPTHAISASSGDGVLRVLLAKREEIPDRDCVLNWEPPQDAERPTLLAFASTDTDQKHAYFLALVAPPSSADSAKAAPREVIVLVDHSGSMSGPKWQAADWTVEKLLSGLGPRDSFALGLFHNATRWFAPRLSAGDANTVEQAVRFLKESTDSGGTELGVALEQGLGLSRSSGDASRHVLLITDAQVSDEGRILRLAESEIGRRDARRINVICIDAAPNSHLALQLAERTGGIARFLTSSPDEEDISTTLDEILTDWAQPLFANLALQVNRPEAIAAGRRVPLAGKGLTAIDLGDLPAGRAVWAVGRVNGAPQDLTLRVMAGDQELACTTPTREASDGGMGAARALFGAWQVLALEQLIAGDYSPEDLSARLVQMGIDAGVLDGSPGDPRVYVENRREQTVKALRGLLVQEALAHGIVCSETAFVAVRSEKGKVVEATTIMPNALPAGWDEGFLTAGAPRAQYAMMAQPMAPPQSGKRSSRRTFLSRASQQSMAKMAFSPEYEAIPPVTETIVFSGTPTFVSGEAVLFDSAIDPTRFASAFTLSRLSVRFPGGAPAWSAVDRGISILVFVSDLSSPRARVSLADMVRQGGVRPLNIRRADGEPIRVVIVDRAGAWSSQPPSLEVALT